MTENTIAFLGTSGSYSHQAATRLRPDGALVGFPGFEAIIAAVEAGDVASGLLPLENSASGTIPSILPLLAGSELVIAEEFFLPVDHALIGVQHVGLDRISAVISHSQGFAQTSDFLASKLPGAEKRVTGDTASAIRTIMRDRDETVAAIGSPFAAEIHGATVLVENIANRADNTTRFVLVQRDHTGDGPQAITSLVIQVNHTASALAKALAVVGQSDINLVKLDSFKLPRIGYDPTFYIELGAARSDPRFSAAMKAIAPFISYSKFLGSYASAEGRRAVAGFLSAD
ncbi:MAG: prephenate dehydratase domain-containing protein [Erythrobacter sp.]|jgi:prephenate dehydratase|nr:prephenate dehydratase domain-containing protein [Erythrobacter sp.]